MMAGISPAVKLEATGLIRRAALKGRFMARPRKKHASPQSLNAAVKAICDIMRRSNCAGALQYVPELTWILFLRILDEREEQEGEHAEALGVEFRTSLESPYRWRDWAAPGSPKRNELEAGTLGSV